MRSWKKTSASSWQCTPWTICKVTMNGEDKFELWHDQRPAIVARLGSMTEAMDRAREEEGSDE